MALFFPDIVDGRDRTGFGQWLNSHYYEHQQFIQIGLQQVNPIQFVNFDLLAWDDNAPETKTAWLNSHESMHESLRGATGVASVDLSSVDPENEESFQVWLQWHATEHQALRAAFGVS